MQTTATIIVIGIILIVGLIALSRSRRWTTLATARGDQSGTLEAKNSYLHSHNIRSRIHADSAGPAMGIATVGAADDNRMYKLEVKPKDKERAEALLADFEREQLLHSHSDPTL